MSRPLHTIPDNTSVMVDANVFVYGITPQARFHESCRALLERGARGAIRLTTTVTIMADVIHRAMMLEALQLGIVQHAGDVVSALKRQPQLVTRLTRHQTVLRDLRQAQVDILALTYRDLHASRHYREHHGLLVNDSLIVAAMRRERIAIIATNDADFDRIPDIAVRTPAG